jgi:hypothetical protein
MYLQPSSGEEEDCRDLTLRCVDCGADFTFSVGEQLFFAQRDFRRPRRCGPCRRLKRAEYASEPRHGWSKASAQASTYWDGGRGN